MSNFSFIPLIVSENKIFFNIFRKIALHLAPATNHLSNLDKSHMERGGLLRVDVNEELKYLGKFKKKMGWGSGWGGQDGCEQCIEVFYEN